MNINIQHRSNEAELLDEECLPEEQLYKNLNELGLVNKYLGGHAVSVSGFQKLAGRSSRISFLDIGMGGGDTLKSIADHCRKENRLVKFAGIDINPAIAAFAKDRLKEYPEIEVFHSGYNNFLTTGPDFDIIHCSLFLHHLSDLQIQDFINLLKKKSRIGFIINDLHRAKMAYYSISALASALPVSTLFRNDAPLSVLKGFTKAELLSFFDDDELGNVNISWHWPYRLLLVYNHTRGKV